MARLGPIRPQERSKTQPTLRERVNALREEKDGEGVVQTFFELAGTSWQHLDRDLQLAQKLRIDAQTFRRALAEHLGVPQTAG